MSFCAVFTSTNKVEARLKIRFGTRPVVVMVMVRDWGTHSVSESPHKYKPVFVGTGATSTDRPQ